MATPPLFISSGWWPFLGFCATVDIPTFHPLQDSNPEKKMAYNLDSCIRILEEEHHHLTFPCAGQIQCPLEALRSIVQICPPTFPISSQNLEIRIRDAAHKVEDIIESHIINHHEVHSPPGDNRDCQLHLTSLIEEITSISSTMRYDKHALSFTQYRSWVKPE